MLGLNMECFKKKIIILLAILVTISNIAGCSVEKEDKLNEVESSNHYYTRSEIKVPVEDKPLYISKSQSDGIYVVTSHRCLTPMFNIDA